VPNTSDISPFEKKNPYPYSVTKARSLLSSHGWKVVPGGTSTCIDPAKCGAGIPAGAQLDFNMQYASGLPALTEEVTTEKSAWAEAGIKINLSSATYNTIGGNTVACSGASCTWEIENSGGGWTYAPGSFPTGEQLSLTGAVSNKQSYSSATNDRLVRLTNTSSSLSDLYNYENYQAEQLPVIYQPNIDPSLTEISKNLVGAVPQNPLSSINPEFWYFTK
jgi:peptide/nickel transport system substrate-binding protein